MSQDTPFAQETLPVYTPEAPETEIVPPGYRQTEVGVIPADWEVSTLGGVCVTSSGTTPSRSMRDRYYNTGTIHWVKTMDLNNSYIDATDERVTPLALSETSLRTYPVGTVLVAMYGGFNQIGRTGLLRIPAAVNQAITAVQPNADKLDSAYLLAILNYNVEHWKSVASSSRKDPNITGADIRAFRVAYPEIAEQRAIASALSDVDTLISSLDRLISKKRAIKTAAMQQLLTGKQRLHGFKLEKGYKQTEAGVIPRDWRVRQLGSEIVRLDSGVSVNSVDEDLQTYAHNHFILKTSAVSGGLFLSMESKKIAPKDIHRARLNPCANTIIVSRMNTLDLVGEIGYVDREYPNHFLPDRLWMTRFRKDSDVCVRWLSYLLSSKEYKRKLKDAASGTSGSMKNISKSSLLAIVVPLPSEREQTAIAAVLSDMDAEISALETRREKTWRVKQGMMQELLTGRTRLVPKRPLT